MAKNIVVCCDGTGNEVGREGAPGGFRTKTSNVLKLYRCLPDGDGQITHYNPGVGTLGGQDLWAPAVEAFNRIRGLALGWGLDRDVLSAYRVIAETYEDGDRIYLFGFSRGAYTVRIVAGLIHLVGLLRREQMNLAPHAFRSYKRSERDPTIDKDDVAETIRDMDRLATETLIEEIAAEVAEAPDEAAAAARIELKLFGDLRRNEAERVKIDFRLTEAEKARAEQRAEDKVDAAVVEKAKARGGREPTPEEKAAAESERAKAVATAVVIEREASVETVRLALSEEVKIAALRAKRDGADIEAAIRAAVGTRKVAATDYDPGGRDPREPYGRYFGRMVGARRVPIHFVGVWDTVGSVIAPGPFWLIPQFFRMAHIWSNPSVRYFRQAASIDEKRRMFRLEPWIVDSHVEKPEEGGFPAAKQVWFAGYHSDVGGGFTSEANDVSDFPLRWMIGEAKAADLSFDLEMVDHLLKGTPYGDQPVAYVAPAEADAAKAKIHDSMNFAWALIEYLPSWARRRIWPERHRIWLLANAYFPRHEPRIIPDDALMHWSAVRRRKDAADYEPPNWPKNWDSIRNIARDLPLRAG